MKDDALAERETVELVGGPRDGETVEARIGTRFIRLPAFRASNTSVFMVTLEYGRLERSGDFYWKE